MVTSCYIHVLVFRIYLQQTINHPEVGDQIVVDYFNFKWDLLQKYQNKLGWGPLTSNLLLVGLEGENSCLSFPISMFEFANAIEHELEKKPGMFKTSGFILFIKSSSRIFHCNLN